MWLVEWVFLRLQLRLTAFTFFSNFFFCSATSLFALYETPVTTISKLYSTMPSDKVEKKRKRASDRHERPTKKPALDLQSLPPLKSSLTKDDSELAPVLSM